ncbi:MAG TPA: hypothetical protein VMG39_02480 [Pseudolabrys sp.]|nr:hypothetical protein [Pseudolabrys sp.]
MTMKPRDIAIAILLIAAAASQFALKEQRAMDEQRMVAAEPDFALLHRQARDALAALRQSHERRLALAVSSTR